MRTAIAWIGLLAVCLPVNFAVADVVMTNVSVDAFRNAEGTPIDVIHSPLGESEEGVLLENQFGPGVLWADINRDGWPDLMMTNGKIGYEGYGAVGNFLLLNNGDGTFAEVAEWYGVWESDMATGLSAADCNNDGLLDIVVGHMGAEPFYFLGRPTRFQELAEYYGINPLLYDASNPPPWPVVPETMGIAFGDYNEDGFVDLYFANYLYQQDLLFENLGGSYFDRTERVEVTSIGYGFQAVFLDFDNDADLDIYVANDFGFNFLFVNQGEENDYDFEERAKVFRVTGGDHGEEKSMAMGVAVGDFDNDLDLDIYLTNYYENTLFINGCSEAAGGVWTFSEAAEEKGVEWEWNCWGSDWADLDNDGDLDLMLTSGFISGKPGAVQEKYLPNKMWLNNGPPNYDFTEISDAAGFNDDSMGRGLATADYDRDGDLDVVVGNATYHDPDPGPGATIYEGRLQLYRNDQSEGNHWVVLRLVGGGVHSPGSGCNLSAVGARVYVTAGDLTQMREIRAGNSYLSQSSMEVEFGFGTRDTIDEVLVRWPCGDEEIFTGADVDGFYWLVETEGEVTALPVALTSFQAIPLQEGIRLEWVIAPGVQVEEYRVLRGPADQGDLGLREILPEFIAGSGPEAVLDRDVQPGARYAYQLELRGEDGVAVQSALVYASAVSEGALPSRALLSQNFPNPFNPNTKLFFSLPEAGQVRLIIHDARGRRIRTLFSGFAPAGETRLQWDGTDDSGDSVSSGVYTYTLETERGSLARRLVLVK